MSATSLCLPYAMSTTSYACPTPYPLLPTPIASTCYELAVLTSGVCWYQIVCVALWSMDEYWYYSLFTFFMLLVFEGTVVFSRTRNIKVLYQPSPPFPLKHIRLHTKQLGRLDPPPTHSRTPKALCACEALRSY